MKTGFGAVWRRAALAVALTALAAHAHPQTSYNVTVPQPGPGDLQGGLYVWAVEGVTSIWAETNGMPTNGMFADDEGSADLAGVNGTINPSGNAALGLQIHNVCYGTFTDVTMSPTGCVLASDPPPPGPDCLNFHHQSCLFTYLPWGYFANGAFVDGSEAACTARGGTFVPKDTLLYGQYSNLTKHYNSVASDCFPAGYGQ